MDYERKRKIKLRKRLLIVSYVIVIYIFTLSLGYAIYNESLSIHGVATAQDPFSGTTLPTSPIILDTTNNRYYTASATNRYIIFYSESWQGDTYRLDFQKRPGLAAGRKTEVYQISFRNNTNYQMTNGTTSINVIKNNTGALKSYSSSLSDDTLDPGETVTISFSVTYSFLSYTSDAAVETIISYDLFGQTRYLHFEVHYNSP